MVPVIKAKWGDVLICSNLGDSINSYQWYKGNSILPGATQQYYTTNKLPGSYSVETTDFEGCVNGSNVISAIGLKSLTLFPNPAAVSFTLSLNDPTAGNAVVSVLNSNGIKMMEFQTPNSEIGLRKEIPVSNLEEGIYVVQVMLNQQILYSTKMVVKK